MEFFAKRLIQLLTGLSVAMATFLAFIRPFLESSISLGERILMRFLDLVAPDLDLAKLDPRNHGVDMSESGLGSVGYWLSLINSVFPLVEAVDLGILVLTFAVGLTVIRWIKGFIPFL